MGGVTSSGLEVVCALAGSIEVAYLADGGPRVPDGSGRAFSEIRWQMDARVRSAQRLMIDDPPGSLADVAALTGFADQSHLRALLDIV